MYQGIVKWFNNQKGFGFIEPEVGELLFVHYTALRMEGYRSLHRGDLVFFDIQEGERGPQATNVYVKNTKDKNKE